MLPSRRRRGGLLPWDNDLDIVMWPKDIDTLRQKLNDNEGGVGSDLQEAGIIFVFLNA